MPNQPQRDAARLRRMRWGFVLACSLAILVVLLMAIYYVTPSTGQHGVPPATPVIGQKEPDSPGIIQPIKDTDWYTVTALVADLLSTVVSLLAVVASFFQTARDRRGA